jgi:hypothetical protein
MEWGALSPAFVMSNALRTWEGTELYNCLGGAESSYLSGEEDLQILSFFEVLKGDGEQTVVQTMSLLGGLSTTPSWSGALEKSIVDEASAAENMKNPLLFPSEGPGFPDPNDSVLVAPTKIDSDMIKQSFYRRIASCNLHNNEIANSCTQEVWIGQYIYKIRR